MSNKDRTRPSPRGAPQQRKQRRAHTQIQGPIEARGDDRAAAALTRAWEVASGPQSADLTHGFHAYPARMHPRMARHLVAELSEPGQVVLDPFVGSGTVAIEALAAGRTAVGVDVNPVALRVAWSRTRLWSDDDLSRFLAIAEAISEDAFRGARKKVPVQLGAGGLPQKGWYPPHVLLELQTLWNRIHKESDPDFLELSRMIFSSLLVKVSYQASESSLERVTKKVGRGTASRLFGSKARLLVEGLRALAVTSPPDVPPVELQLGDARELRDIPTGSVDVIITSPPYPGVYDYASHQERRYSWLGVRPEEAARREIGRRGEGEEGDLAARWQADEAAFLTQMARVLCPGGLACLVVGDSILGGKAWLADGALYGAAQGAGLEAVAIASQARPTTHPELARAFSREPRKEHVMLFQKPQRR